MDILNDDEWLIIFKQFNLNERTHLRLVSKRFKSLLDTIKITKLIIYERWPAVPDQLMHTDEPFSIQDTVEVYDLNKFFNNPIILEQMRSIRQLVIEGCSNEKEINLNTAFTKLNYLRLQGVVFTNSSLLQSTELEYLMLNFVFLNSMEKCNANLNEIEQFGLSDYSRSPSVFSYQFNELRSRKIKYLNLNFIYKESEFLSYCIEHGLFSSLEQIDVSFFDFESLILLNDRCPSLKRVNCLVGVNNKSFSSVVDEIKYPNEQLRGDLSVYLFGTYECPQVLLIIELVLLEHRVS